MRMGDVLGPLIDRKCLDGMHVVVAEDDYELRTLIVEMLLADGARVTETASGLAAVDRMRTLHAAGESPDFVVSDVRMPGISGLEVLERLGREGLLVPTVLITAFGDEDVHNRAAQLGATAVFDKPFDIDDLRTVLLLMASSRSSS